MKKNLFKLIAVLASCTCFAQEAIDTVNDEIFNEIVANKNTCVVGCYQERIYLNHDRIFPTKQGLYLNLNDVDYVLLPTLNSDGNGCYLPVTRHQILNICPGCGQEYFITCDNPNCPLVQQKEERERERERQREHDRERRREQKEERKKNKK